jgi:hypothetical protein
MGTLFDSHVEAYRHGGGRESLPGNARRFEAGPLVRTQVRELLGNQQKASSSGR